MKPLAQIPDPDDSVLAPADLAEVRSGKKIELCRLIEAKSALAEIALVLLWIERNFHSLDYSPSGNSNGGWPRSRRIENHTEGAPGPSLLGTREVEETARDRESARAARSCRQLDTDPRSTTHACSSSPFRPLTPAPNFTAVNAFLHAKHTKNGAKWPQKHVPEPVLTTFREILWLHTLLFGQFHGSTHQLDGQFHGICLKES